MSFLQLIFTDKNCHTLGVLSQVTLLSQAVLRLELQQQGASRAGFPLEASWNNSSLQLLLAVFSCTLPSVFSFLSHNGTPLYCWGPLGKSIIISFQILQ
jgi:hypothetical protein